MADFKVAIEALANGKLEISALSKQLSKLLLDNPKFATRFLEQLDEANEQGKIDNTVYTELKRQINDFRRSHAKETETGVEVSPEATVFDNSKVGDAVGSEDSTEINQRSEAVGSEDST